MKPLKLRKVLLTIIASMCLCSDIIYIPTHATELDGTTPATDVNPGTDNPGGEGTTNPDGGTTNPDGGTTNPDGGTTNPDENEPDEPEYIPSDINTLSSLEVKGFDLSPSFNSHTLEYNLTINAGYEKIEIGASKSDYKSSVSGLGEFDVSWKQGTYDFKIVCTAENGNSRTYTIHLEVSSDPYIFAPLNGENLGFVVKGLDELATIPQGFEQSVGSYGGKKITVFNNQAFPFSLVYLQKENKKQDWYCYQDGVVTGSFRKLVINKAVYYYAGVKDSDKKQNGYTYKSVTLTGEQLDGWKVKNNDTKIMVYLYDAMGNADYYIYDTDLGTMQRRREYEVTENKENRSFLKSPVTITAIIVVIIAIVFGITFLKEGKKNNKKENKKEAPKDLGKDKLDPTVELVKTKKIKIYANPIDSSEILDLEIEKTKEFKPEDLNLEKEQVTSMIEEIISHQEETFIEEKEEKVIIQDEQELTNNVENVNEEHPQIQDETHDDKPVKQKRFFFKKKKKETEVAETTVVETENQEEIKEEVEEVYVSSDEEKEAIEEIKNYISELFYGNETESN